MGMTDERLGVCSEPEPCKTERAAVWDLVIADMRERDTVGAEKYGTRLQADNGRRSLVDAYQEALDLVVYIRKEIEERRRIANERDFWRAECEKRAEYICELEHGGLEPTEEWGRGYFCQSCDVGGGGHKTGCRHVRLMTMPTPPEDAQ